jgi:hypothetical protein
MRFGPNSPVPRQSQDLDMVMMEEISVVSPNKNVKKAI